MVKTQLSPIPTNCGDLYSGRKKVFISGTTSKYGNESNEAV